MGYRSLFLIALLSFAGVGCSHDATISDSQGNKITMNSGDGNVLVTAADGTKGSVTTDKDGTVVSTGIDANGEKSSMTTKKDGTTSIESKDGSASIGGGTTITEAELQVPFYPGSTEKKESNMKFEGKDEKTYSAVRETSDTPDQVGNFYKEKVKGLTIMSAPDASSGSGTLPSGATFAFAAQKKDGKTEVMVTMTMKTKK